MQPLRVDCSPRNARLMPIASKRHAAIPTPQPINVSTTSRRLRHRLEPRASLRMNSDDMQVASETVRTITHPRYGLHSLDSHLITSAFPIVRSRADAAVQATVHRRRELHTGLTPGAPYVRTACGGGDASVRAVAGSPPSSTGPRTASPRTPGDMRSSRYDSPRRRKSSPHFPQRHRVPSARERGGIIWPSRTRQWQLPPV